MQDHHRGKKEITHKRRVILQKKTKKKYKFPVLKDWGEIEDNSSENNDIRNQILNETCRSRRPKKVATPDGGGEEGGYHHPPFPS